MLRHERLEALCRFWETFKSYTSGTCGLAKLFAKSFANLFARWENTRCHAKTQRLYERHLGYHVGSAFLSYANNASGRKGKAVTILNNCLYCKPCNVLTRERNFRIRIHRKHARGCLVESAVT